MVCQKATAQTGSLPARLLGTSCTSIGIRHLRTTGTQYFLANQNRASLRNAKHQGIPPLHRPTVSKILEEGCSWPDGGSKLRQPRHPPATPNKTKFMQAGAIRWCEYRDLAGQNRSKRDRRSRRNSYLRCVKLLKARGALMANSLSLLSLKPTRRTVCAFASVVTVHPIHAHAAFRAFHRSFRRCPPGGAVFACLMEARKCEDVRNRHV